MGKRGYDTPRTMDAPPSSAANAHARPAEPISKLTAQQRTRWTHIGVLAALSLLLGYLETFVPIPIPGVRLGLANVAILIALGTGDRVGAIGVAIIKVIAGSLLFGSPVMLAYSAVGTTLALVIMVPISRLPTMHIVMTSMVGAIAHEGGQLLVARMLLSTSYVWIAAPPLLVAALGSGALCGSVTNATLRALNTSDPASDAWARRLWAASGQKEAPLHKDGRSRSGRSRTTMAMVVFVVAVAFLLHATGAMLAAAVLATLLACALARVSATRIVHALRPLAVLAIITAVAQALATTEGRSVISVGALSVTDAALLATLTLVGRFVGIGAASLVFTQLTSADDIMQGIDAAAAALEKRGIHAAGLGLALGIALRLAPALVAAWDEGGSDASMPTSLREVPRALAALYRMADDDGRCVANSA